MLPSSLNILQRENCSGTPHSVWGNSDTFTSLIYKLANLFLMKKLQPSSYFSFDMKNTPCLLHEKSWHFCASCVFIRQVRTLNLTYLIKQHALSFICLLLFLKRNFMLGSISLSNLLNYFAGEGYEIKSKNWNIS